MFCIAIPGLFASPLESGYALAPRASATAEEKAQAYINARLRVIEAAKKYLGTPYRYGGMTSAGLDCSGFLGLSFRDALGVTLPRSASALYAWVIKIPIEKAQPGDFVFFRTDGTSNITHVGLYLGNRTFIHAASSGSQTGVIYSNLDERYYINTYAGAGRAFPEAAPFNIDNPNSNNTNTVNNPSSSGSKQAVSNNGKGRVYVGVAFAPVWNSNMKDGLTMRGFTSQLCIEIDTFLFGSRNIYGLELRPEYDDLFKVFRLPITVSWGVSDNIKFFAGPVFTSSETWGSTWRILAGVTVIPFSIKSANNVFSPYIEAVWQSNFSDGKNISLNTDFYTGFRFNTGIKWLIHIL